MNGRFVIILSLATAAFCAVSPPTANPCTPGGCHPLAVEFGCCKASIGNYEACGDCVSAACAANTTCTAEYLQCPPGTQNGGPEGTFTAGGHMCLPNGPVYQPKDYTGHSVFTMWHSACCACAVGATGSPNATLVADANCSWCGTGMTTAGPAGSECVPCPAGTTTFTITTKCRNMAEDGQGLCCGPAPEGKVRSPMNSYTCEYVNPLDLPAECRP